MPENEIFDAVIIGSGFGGGMMARQLVDAGFRVAMVERGDWVKRGPDNWGPRGSLMLTDHYSVDAPFLVHQSKKPEKSGLYECVGGPSVFYGGVSMRFRETDFHPQAEIIADSKAEWPFEYGTLESYYGKAEHILDVSGEAGVDPTDPTRSTVFPQSPGRLSGTSTMIGEAAKSLGLKPFRLPLALNYRQLEGRNTCEACTTCDTFACAVGAKNDISTVVIPKLVASGMTLLTKTIATRLETDGNNLKAVHCVDRTTGDSIILKGKVVILSAGALSSPHLLLASDLQKKNPAGEFVGRYLMRHCNAIAYGIFPINPDPVGEFHKQLGIHDFYNGHPSIAEPSGKLGTIQQIQTPPAGLVEAVVPKPFGKVLSKGVSRLTGLLIIAEDQPQYENRVSVNPEKLDAFGMPSMIVESHYSPRDIAARAALLDKAKLVLKRAGAWVVYKHMITTFSHSVGTVRLGDDANTAPLDPDCRFRGVDNLFVVDGSFMPTSAGINPSLTIAANALRVSEAVITQLTPPSS
jgi:choline dehydrogenase-like flavoprotein